MKMTQSLETRNPLSDATRKSRMAFVWVAVFSCAVNLLMLTGPLFMLQVYDRVLASRSVPTLLALFALVAVLYGFLALFSYVRSAWRESKFSGSGCGATASSKSRTFV